MRIEFGWESDEDRHSETARATEGERVSWVEGNVMETIWWCDSHQNFNGGYANPVDGRFYCRGIYEEGGSCNEREVILLDATTTTQAEWCWTHGASIVPELGGCGKYDRESCADQSSVFIVARSTEDPA